MPFLYLQYIKKAVGNADDDLASQNAKSFAGYVLCLFYLLKTLINLLFFGSDPID